MSVWAVLTASDHPRIRGEHDKDMGKARELRGSSPHTRGARDGRGLACRSDGIIPAYAGSTRAAPSPAIPPADHPRIRGEHFRGILRRSEIEGSSPHTRGAPDTARAWVWNLPDHPRIRGEHVPVPAQQRPDAGSSPHTRGAPDHA